MQGTLPLSLSCPCLQSPMSSGACLNPDSTSLAWPLPAPLDSSFFPNIPKSSKLISPQGLFFQPFHLLGSLSHQALTWFTPLLHSGLFKLSPPYRSLARPAYLTTIPPNLPLQHSLSFSTFLNSTYLNVKLYHFLLSCLFLQ